MKKQPSLETLIAELPLEAQRQLDQFKHALVPHSRLQQVEQDLLETILEPAGFVPADLQADLGHGFHRQRIELAGLDPGRFDIEAAAGQMAQHGGRHRRAHRIQGAGKENRSFFG